MKKIFIFLFVLHLNTKVEAIDISKIKFDYITVDDGLSQSTVEDIFQDSQGFIWIATRDGLNRYNGINFEVFRNNRNDSSSLYSNFIHCIGEDSEGKIWIGSDGLNVFDPTTNKMSRVLVNPRKKDAFHGGPVYDILLDIDKSVWFATNFGLAHYLPTTGAFETFSHNAEDPTSLTDDRLYDVTLTRARKIFVGGEGDQIDEFDRNNKNFIHHSYKTNYLGQNFMKNISEDNNGLLYIGAEYNNIHIYNPLTHTSKELPSGPGGLSASTIKTEALVMADDEIWIGTDGGGINIYNPLNETFQYLVPDSKVAHSLNGSAVFDLTKDKDGNIWVGHFGVGISIYKKYKEKFTSYFHNPFNALSLNKEVVTAIYEDSQGRIWIGQDGGGLNLFEEGTQTFKHFMHDPTNSKSLPVNVILAIQEDPDGNLLLGTYAGGMIKFDPNKEEVIKSYSPADGLSVLNVWRILPDMKGRYWLTTLGSGVDIFDPASETFRIFRNTDPDPKVCSNVLLTMTLGPDGRMWLGSQNAGICIYDVDKDIVTNYTHSSTNINSLSHVDVSCIYFQDHYAWIATNGGGLNRLDLKTDSIKVYTINEGLTSNALMGILADDDKNLWISSTRGLIKFNPYTELVTVFEKSQGIQGNEFKYNSQFRLKDGRMLFGGVNGLTIFNPDSVKGSPIVPNVVFTDFKILNQSVAINVKGSPLKNHINSTEFLKLKHSQNVFTFEFASLDYSSPDKNRYMYKMEGFNEEWIDAGNINFVTYTNLDAGTYTFWLKGSNSDGVWNETPRSIKIRIRPPWYKTKLFLLILLLAVSGLIYLYIRERERQAKHDKLILQQKIDEGKAELDERLREIDAQRDEIIKRDEAEKEMRFQNEGIAKFSEIIATNRKDLDELSTNLIARLVEYVGAGAGAIFIVNDFDPSNILLRASGKFCFDSDNERKYEFMAGEGYVGTCYSEVRTIIIDNVPKGQIVLRSGLGHSSLTYLLLVPVINESKVHAVLEIASLNKLESYKVNFIEKIVETFASVIAITKANERTNEMLEQNRMQSEELMAQEEEMRQNLEELQATQEMTSRKEDELKEDMLKKDKLIKQMKDKIKKLESGK